MLIVFQKENDMNRDKQGLLLAAVLLALTACASAPAVQPLGQDTYQARASAGWHGAAAAGWSALYLRAQTHCEAQGRQALGLAETAGPSEGLALTFRCVPANSVR